MGYYNEFGKIRDDDKIDAISKRYNSWIRQVVRFLMLGDGCTMHNFSAADELRFCTICGLKERRTDGYYQHGYFAFRYEGDQTCMNCMSYTKPHEWPYKSCHERSGVNKTHFHEGGVCSKWEDNIIKGVNDRATQERNLQKRMLATFGAGATNDAARKKIEDLKSELMEGG